MISEIEKQLKESSELKRRCSILSEKISDSAMAIINAYRNGNKVLVCGSGGSAADSQHFVGELVSKFRFERPALPAIALTTNTSVITAIGNDYSYESVFLRQVEANATKGDILFVISTSGNSKSIIKAIEAGKEKGLKIIGLTGESGGLIKDMVDILINVPSSDTPRIQEAHITIIHILCDLIESSLFKNE